MHSERPPHIERPPTLPPREFRLAGVGPKNKIPTPLDERGLVDVEQLITNVKETVDPSYRWTSPFNDIHHTQWPNRHYLRLPHADANPQDFRELAISKVKVPRVFHNWTHIITEPPPLPDKEVMRYRIEAQRVAIALFQTVRVCIGLTRSSQLSDAALETALIRHFDTFTTNLTTAKELPPSFQPIDFTNYEPRTYQDMFSIGGELGRVAVINSAVNRVTRPLRV